jgi:signal transduction histidine kinase/CheY-like chemotaxis protein
MNAMWHRIRQSSNRQASTDKDVDYSLLENTLRLRLLALTVRMCLVLGTLWGISFYWYGSVQLAVVFIAGVGVLAAVHALGRQLGQPPLIGHLVLLEFLLGVVVANYATGGLARANSVLYFVVALIGIFLLGRAGLVWVGLSGLALLAFLGLHETGFEFPDVVPPEHRLMDMGFTLLFSLLTLLGVVGFSELSRRLGVLQLLDAKRKAEQASESRRMFLAKASHELRTPLNAILGLCDIMETDIPNPRCAEHLAAVRQSALSLRRLVEDLLDVSRIDAAKLQLHAVPFEPRPLFAEVVAELSPRARAQGIEIVFEAEPDVPARMLGDTLRIRQIAVNLIENAVKYSGRGRVTVNLAAATTVGIRLRVVDSGPGIPAELLPRLFEPFQRGQESGGVDGSGLGLHITQQLCQIMGGSIRAENLPQGGARFEAVLPLPPAPEVAAGHRILAAEDDPISRMLVKTILERKGYRVETVADGNAAAEAAESLKPDLILMDVNLPGIDGLEAARRIRKAEADSGGRRVPILAMTAHVLSEERDRCFQAGMDDFIGKPVQAAQLLQSVAHWLSMEVRDAPKTLAIPSNDS